MRSRRLVLKLALAGACQCAAALPSAIGGDAVRSAPEYRIHLDTPHPWRPPFGLDRIGQPITAVVDSSARPDRASYVLAAFSNGIETRRYVVKFSAAPPFSARVTL